jgi:hypothetical protein
VIDVLVCASRMDFLFSLTRLDFAQTRYIF